MSLRTRMIVSFCILLFIPALLMVMIFWGASRLPNNEVHYMIHSMGKLGSDRWRIVLDILLATVAILIFTDILLTMWIYRGIVNPIRRLQAAEEKLANERENKELISNISHDLKTPITAIKGYVEGIMDGVADTPEKMDKYIRTIYTKTNDMDSLINELTLYAHIDTSRIPYEFTRIRAKDYFADCVEDLSLDLESSGISLLYFNHAGDKVRIKADPEQLKRAIHNIIGNSVKYMDKPIGRILMRIWDKGDFIQVEIEDNGKGIAQKDLPHIFDRFYRTDTSRNSATGGSGIGLSIVKKIIEDHGGRIWAESKESAGTTIYFMIPKYKE